jgi:hypothetical protein
MTFSLPLAVCTACLCLTETATPASGTVVVLANRTRHEVQFTLGPVGQKPKAFVMPMGDLAAVPVTGVSDVSFSAGKTQRRYLLHPDTAYYFADFADGLDLKEIGIGDSKARPQPVAGGAELLKTGEDKSTPPRVLTVKIVVDQHEPGRQALWEKRLRSRIASASWVLEHYCNVRLQVVAAEEWQSDDKADNLSALLLDFDRKVKAHPAKLVIGYTSQRLSKEGVKPAGMTRRALHDHILVREWWPPSEQGLHEVLLHELGHYLGAAHSPEIDSVMRANLSIKERGRIKAAFDPLNTLAMNLVAAEVLDHGVKRLSEVRPRVKQRLREIYRELARAMPDDLTPAQYLNQLDGTPLPPRKKAATASER